MALFIISLISYLLFSISKTKKSFHMLQQNFYDESGRYISWVWKNKKKTFLNIDIIFPLVLITYFFSKDISACLIIIFYFILLLIYHNQIKHDQSKKPLVITARIKRLFLVTMLLYAFIIGISYYFLKEYYLIYLVLGLITYLNYILVWVANICSKPIEKMVYLHYKHQAIKKLKAMNIPVIGITGSYGKTSSKNIVSDILNIKYNPFPTPKNFNTTYGLINSINNYLDKFNDIFIAEMGAFKRGEIKKTCDLMHPKYGIITTIGEAHLESFGSRENIQKGKFELVESLIPGGFAILNGDDPYQRSYQIKNNCDVYWIGIENHDVDLYADNIKLSHTGTSFDIHFKGDDNTYSFKTKLLGKHNVYNILSGILLGKKLGMSIDELKRGVNSIKVIEHRLELKKYGTINIIDDAYNSNPVGSKMAVEVLGLMPGTKIIVTPGMIELGEKQYELNYKFGTYIAQEVDYAILIGKNQTKPIYDGIIASNFDKDKIYVLNDVKEAFPLMRKLEHKDTYVLLENDLPDLFNE